MPSLHVWLQRLTYTAKNVLIISTSILNFNITACAECETVRIKKGCSNFESQTNYKLG